jgi:ankyrin repeat protein
LLKNGADIDFLVWGEPKIGWAPLLIAIYFSHIDAVHFLLEYGSNTFLKNNNRHGALHLMREDNYEMANLC